VKVQFFLGPPSLPHYCCGCSIIVLFRSSKHGVGGGLLILEAWFDSRDRSQKIGEEASMVMQWTVNPPSSGTTGSIPVFPTSFSTVRLSVRTLPFHGRKRSSILLRCAKLWRIRETVSRKSHKLQLVVRFHHPQPN
jgi:hypothetical protein